MGKRFPHETILVRVVDIAADARPARQIDHLKVVVRIAAPQLVPVPVRVRRFSDLISRDVELGEGAGWLMLDGFDGTFGHVVVELVKLAVIIGEGIFSFGARDWKPSCELELFERALVRKGLEATPLLHWLVKRNGREPLALELRHGKCPLLLGGQGGGLDRKRLSLLDAVVLELA